MSRIIFFNNKFVPEEKAQISVMTHALHYGTGCYEGIRAYYNSKDKSLYVFRMKDHYERFSKSTKILFISLSLAINQLCDTTIELLKKNFSEEDLYIRPLAFKSDPAVGNFNLKTLKDGFVLYTVPLGRYLNNEKGIRANVSSWRRVPDNSIPARAKITGSYVNTSLAKTESLSLGYDEALLMDERNHIVEGSAENIFIVRNGKVITPPVSDDILEGITRNTVMMLCEDELNLQVDERSIDRSEIYQADEVFLVGTGAEISPVVEIDKRMISDGSIGKVSKKIKELYYQITHGENQKYRNFVTKVSK